jgi:hypothetical protein
MLTPLRAAVALAALALAAPTFAQQQASHPRVGLGISMNTSLVTPLVTLGSSVFAPPTLLYVPFYLAPNVRIEPTIGWIKVNDDQNDVTSSAFQLGIGAVILKPVTASTNLYGGARLSSVWDRDETRVSPIAVRKDTQRNTDLALVIGGEYLPTPWFSVGAEGQLDFVWMGDVTHDQTGVPRTTTSGGSASSTQALLFIRVYFL